MAKANIDNGPNPRVVRALHRFAERVEADVQEALDAAKARRLAPFESVLRCCEYLQARYVSPEPVRALPNAPSAITCPSRPMSPTDVGGPANCGRVASLHSEAPCPCAPLLSGDCTLCGCWGKMRAFVVLA
jgi:hypothetical protein